MAKQTCVQHRTGTSPTVLSRLHRAESAHHAGDRFRLWSCLRARDSFGDELAQGPQRVFEHRRWAEVLDASPALPTWAVSYAA